MEQTDKIDELLGTTCYVIDFLPEQVKPDTGGQFFDVEYYLLNSEKHFSMKDRFVNVILKLMCYYHVSIQWKGWIRCLWRDILRKSQECEKEESYQRTGKTDCGR